MPLQLDHCVKHQPNQLRNHRASLLIIVYDALSRPQTVTYANGVTETNQYHANRHWLTRRDYQRNGANVFYFNSTGGNDFDLAGNLKKVAYKYFSRADTTVEYAYDNLYRLNQFKLNGNAVRSYDYDPNGNTIAFTGKTLAYGNDNNQLTSDGSRSFQYDAAGRVRQVNSTVITHDFRSNMTSYGSNTYTYDAFGQRLRKTESDTSRYYITSGPQVLAEYTSNAAPDAEYIYALDRMVAKFEPTVGHSWFYVDHLNSTRLVDGPEAQADMQRDYFPYGETYVVAGTDQSAYQFTQKELDSGIGLHYFGARYYDASLGRWGVPDPAGQYFSPYVYVGNQPLNFVDLDGRLGLPGWLQDGINFLGGAVNDLLSGDFHSNAPISIGGSNLTVTDNIVPGWAQSNDPRYGSSNSNPYFVNEICVGPGCPSLWDRLVNALSLPFTQIYRQMMTQYWILESHGFAALRQYQIATGPNFGLAYATAEAALDIALLGLPSATRTVANWKGSSGYERASAVASLVAGPLGRVASSLGQAKTISNSWNYYQHITKGTGLVKNRAAYEWWKAGGLVTRGRSYAAQQFTSQAVTFYNQNISTIQTAATALDVASDANTLYSNTRQVVAY